MMKSLIFSLSLLFSSSVMADEPENYNNKTPVHEASGPFNSSFKACLDLKCSGHGSAFYIGNDYFLTAGHVGQGEDDLVMKRQDGRIINVETVWVHSQSDWSLMKADKPVVNVEPVELTCNEPKVDDYIYTIGNPASLTFIKTSGKVAGLQEEIEGYKGEHVFVTDMTTYFGNSGGPVFNSKNQVWGNLVAGLQGTSLSIVEPVSKICDILPKVIDVDD